jgi:hypothetical protein
MGHVFFFGCVSVNNIAISFFLYKIIIFNDICNCNILIMIPIILWEDEHNT